MASWTDNFKLFLGVPLTPESLAPQQTSNVVHMLSGVFEGDKPRYAQK
jgi:hypothetical protein